MSQTMTKHRAIPEVTPIVDAEQAVSPWRTLYRAAGAAALISAVFIPIQILVFIIWPPPLEGTASDWFMLFQDNRLVGLLDLDLLLVADNVLLVPIFLALYLLLRRASESVTVVATALGFLGIAFFITSNPAFEMLSLSNQFAAATTEAQRMTLLAAGYISVFSVLFLEIWYLLIARRFFQLGHRVSTVEARR